MKIKKTILTAAILMAAVSLPAQNKSAGINISIWKDICTQPHDSTQTTYINIGLLSTMNRLNGVGINALGSVVHDDMNGVQITGLANLAGGTMRGVQLAGISNISGDNTVGLSAAGLVNITGDRAQGVVISGLTSIGGDNNSGLMISGFHECDGQYGFGLTLFRNSKYNRTDLRWFDGFGTFKCSRRTHERFADSRNCQYNRIKAEWSASSIMQLRNESARTSNWSCQLLQRRYERFQLGLVNANPDTKVQMMVYGGNATPANIGGTVQEPVVLYHIGSGFHVSGIE